RRWQLPTVHKPIRPISWLLLALAVAGTLHLAWNLYQSTVGPNTANLFREYLSMYGIGLGLWILGSCRRSEQS
ncbi:MAG: hypothetical protein ACO39U_07515, partial [Bacteroidia bacterium]